MNRVRGCWRFVGIALALIWGLASQATTAESIDQPERVETVLHLGRIPGSRLCDLPSDLRGLRQRLPGDGLFQETDS
jgi:hypothetical protein